MVSSSDRFQKKSGDSPALVLPRIKHQNFLNAIDAIPGMTSAQRPITEPLVGDLLVTYAVDIGPSYVSLNPSNLGEYGLGPMQLRELAEANAMPILASKLHVRTDDTLYQLSASENLAACAILFPDLWKQIQQELQSPLIVAFAHRDVVFYARANQQGKRAVVEAVAQVDFNDTHSLSRLLYSPTSTGWQVVTP
jgi:uncharacterized protein YtpQ (UPF0354 family)